MKPAASGGLAALIAVVIWGAQFPIAKDTFAVVDAVHVTALRYVIGTALLIPLFVLLEGRSALSYYGRVVPSIVFGVIGMFGSPMLVFGGVALTRPEHAAVIVALQPSLTALADWLVRGRRPSNFTLGCVAAAFVGVVIVITKGRPATMFAEGGLLGDVLVLLGAFCWVTYTMATENFKGWSALRFTTLTLIPGTIASVVFTAVLDALGLLTLPSVAALASVDWQLAYLTLGGVVISMVGWNMGSQRIGALNAMLLLNFVPVVTFAVRAAQGHPFEAIELAGAALVFAALVANNVYLRRLRLAAARPSAVRKEKQT